MLRIQTLNLDNYLEDIQLQLVRTYKGEILRTLTGKVAAFPASFITVGFNIQLLGPRETIIQAQQLLLSADTVLLTATYNGTSIEGKFSCTQNNVVEVRDKGERSLRLTASLVSDGSPITKPGGSPFTIKSGETTLYNNCSFGKVYQLTGAQYTLNDIPLPENKVLVLGDTKVVR